MRNEASTPQLFAFQKPGLISQYAKPQPNNDVDGRVVDTRRIKRESRSPAVLVTADQVVAASRPPQQSASQEVLVLVAEAEVPDCHPP